MGLLGFVSAIAAALFYGVGSVLQAVAAKRTETAESLDPRFLYRMVKQVPYLIGLACDGAGFLVSLVALHFLPLFFVEAVLAGSVGVTAILAVIFLHTKLKPLEIGGLVALMVGLALLAISAKDGPAHQLPMWGRWTLLAGTLVIALATLLSMKYLKGHRSGIALAIISGLAFSGLGVASRTLVFPAPIGPTLRQATIWSVVIYGALGLVLFAFALQRAPVTTVTALVFGIQTTIPALFGILLLGDRSRQGLAWAAITGFILAVVGAILLAGQAEPEPEPESSVAAESAG